MAWREPDRIKFVGDEGRGRWRQVHVGRGGCLAEWTSRMNQCAPESNRQGRSFFSILLACHNQVGRPPLLVDAELGDFSFRLRKV